MRFLRSLAALAAMALVVSSVRALPTFEQSESDLLPDPGIRFGVLPNGVRYAVMANREPRGRASLRLVVGAGSLDEKPDQQGLAHFLEHMAFKGSAHYPPGTLIETLQRMGMSFGADTNAETAQNFTKYQLELPDTKAATLGQGVQILGDYAGRLLLQEKQIDSERGVILSEKRDRDSIEYRTFVATWKFLLPDTIIPFRQPIGLSEVIESAKRDRFVDFYDTWYRPEKLTVIAVGDFDAAAVEGMIRSQFSGLRARAPARPEPPLGTVVSPLGLRVAYHAEPEAPATSVTLMTVFPYRHEPDTAAVRLRHLKRDLAVIMLNRRLEILSRREDAPFTQAEAFAGEELNYYRLAGLELTCKPTAWRRTLAEGEQELRRALEFGFQPEELAEAAANLRNELDQALQGEATRLSNKLSDDIADSVVEREVFTSPEQDEAFYVPALKGITVDDCRDALRQAWAGPGRDVFVSGNVDFGPVVPEQAIGAAYRSSAAQPVERPARIGSEAFPYTNFGPKGRVVSEKTIGDLGVTEVVFANGVRLDLKRTEFEAGRVHVNVRTGGGLLSAPAATEPGIVELANQAFVSGGLGKLGFDEIQRVLAGKPVELKFAVDESAFTLKGSTDSEHVLLELQLLAAYLADPGYRPEALWTARKAIPEQYRQLDHTPEGLVQTRILRILADGDPRFGLAAQGDLMARNLDELRAWLTPQLAGPMEVAIVGELDVNAAIDAVARTLGALPPRPWAVDRNPAAGAANRSQGLFSSRLGPEPPDRLDVHFPAKTSEYRFAVPTEIPRGLLLLVWPTTDAREVGVTRRLNILASIFSDRLRVRIRDEMSGAYSPEAFNEGSAVFPGYGSTQAYLTVDPPRADAIVRAVLAVAGDLEKRGVTADELTRAKNPMLAEIQESERTNEYWLEVVLDRAQEEPWRLDWARTRRSDYAGITAAEVDALGARYLDPARAFRFIVLPAKP